MRRPRQLKENALYHITARTNRQEFILESDAIKQLFMLIVIRAKKIYSFKIYNFCIMDNHIHFLIKPLYSKDLPKIMQWILSNFAVKYNRMNGFHGHVWYDRYKSVIEESYSQFIKAYEYISNNPVKAGIVKNAEEYYYSGSLFIKNRIHEIIEPPGNFSFL